MTRAELIAALETAQGADRPLFEAAFVAVCGNEPASEYSPRGWETGQPTFAPAWEAYISKRNQFYRLLDANAYLDAAMMLVSEGWAFTVASYWNEHDPKPPFFADICDLQKFKTGDCEIYEAYAATPANALAAACLRAGGE